MAYGIKSLAKKVTLEIIYEAVDDRTKAIKEDISELKENISELRAEVKGDISELRADVRSMNTRLDQMFSLLTQIIQQKNSK